MITLQDLLEMGYFGEDEPMTIPNQTVDPLWYSIQFTKVTEQEPSPILYKTLIEEEYQEWREAEWKGDNSNEIKELADLLYVIYGYANARGWDITEALFRVHENNMGRVLQDDGSVLRREDGKIMKNPNAPKINLEDLL